ncbi:MAG TPA: DUF4038 domain-containing protein [Ktedonobacteraceae bacterium]|nr:DUF4038 domain-containing protein [Ktedonobacteraceae bacterium]
MAKQLATTHVWESAELSFAATTTCANPYREVEFQAEFRGPDGRLLVVPGFWDGEQNWKVRFAPPVAGSWHWRTSCSVSSETGLHGQSGSLEALPWSQAEIEANPTRRGFVRVHESGRYFVYADGTPFYWLGDTFWAGFSQRCSLESDFPLYLRDRQDKGFTVIQMVVGRPVAEKSAASYWGGGMCNEGGAPYERRYDLINPAYFQHFDRKMRLLLEAGFIPCLFGAWGQDLQQVGVAAMQEYWRYLVARYAAYNVLWCISGEYYYTPDEESWRQIGQTVHRADPYQHPTSAHAIAPHSGSTHYQGDEWYDFNLIQVGHVEAFRALFKALPQIDYQARPIKPAIMSESWYENHESTFKEAPARFNDRDIRYVTYVSLLSGCIGQTYGAHGVWSWADDQDAADPQFNAPAPWRHDLHLPGSTQMKHLRTLMQEVRWWELEPHPEVVSSTNASAFCAAIPDREYLAYFPQGANRVLLCLPCTGSSQSASDYSARWFNPRSGAWLAVDESTLETVRWPLWFLWWAPTPDDQDWVLLLKKKPWPFQAVS